MVGQYAGEVQGIRHEVPARNEKRLVLEVIVEPMSGVVIGSQLVPTSRMVEKDGTVRYEPRRVVIYASELAAAQARVRTEKHTAALEFARETFEAERKRDLEKEYAAVERAPADRKAAAEQSLRHALAKYPGSPEAIFSKLHKGGVPPIVSLTVIGEYGAPDMPEVREEKARDRLEAVIEKMGDKMTEAIAAVAAPAQRSRRDPQ